jgi:hypothetical protein
MTAFDRGDLALHDAREIRWPVAERRQARARRHADPNRADARQPAALNHGIDEMRGADHHGVNRSSAHDPRGGEALERIENAACNVGRRRRLDGASDSALLDQHRVRVRPADIDADAPHANTGR